MLTDQVQRLVVVIGLSLPAVGCRNPQASSAEHQTILGGKQDRTLAAFVILPAADVASHPRWSGLPATWDPPTNVVAEALLRLPAFLSDPRNEPLGGVNHLLPGVRRRLPNTVCQAIGVQYDQKDGVFLNCLPADTRRLEGWRERYVRVYDGGPRFWTVVYLPEERKFVRLRIDLGY